MTELIDPIQELKKIEAQWTEKDPKIIAAARKMIDEEKLSPEEEEKLQKIYLKRGKKEEYDYLNQQEYLFYKNLPDLIKNYPGLYIWFEEGYVKDTDPDRLTLCSRAVRSDYFRASRINAIYTHQVPKVN